MWETEETAAQSQSSDNSPRHLTSIARTGGEELFFSKKRPHAIAPPPAPFKIC